MVSARKMKGKYTIFIFVDTDPGKDETVLEKLLTYDEVIEVHVISGQYDLLAVLELDLREKPLFTTVKNLAQKSVRKIRKLGGVRDTNTFVPFLSVTKRVE